MNFKCNQLWNLFTAVVKSAIFSRYYKNTLVVCANYWNFNYRRNLGRISKSRGKGGFCTSKIFGIFIALTRFQGFPLYSQGFGIPGIRLFPIVFISMVFLFFDHYGNSTHGMYFIPLRRFCLAFPFSLFAVLSVSSLFLFYVPFANFFLIVSF